MHKHVVHKLKIELKLIKKLLIRILLLGIISIIGYSIFMSNFEVFDKPIETELKTECDDSGLRKVSMYELKGNATTDSSIVIKSSECNADLYSDNLINSELIFSVSSPNLKQSDVKFTWKSFDTLTIMYNKKVSVFQQKKESESLNPKIIFEYITN